MKPTVHITVYYAGEPNEVNYRAVAALLGQYGKEIGTGYDFTANESDIMYEISRTNAVSLTHRIKKMGFRAEVTEIKGQSRSR